MIDRYLNDELRQSLSESQKDLLEKMVAQPYEPSDDEAAERYKKMMEMEQLKQEREEAEEFTKNGYPERAIHRPNYTPPSNIDRKKRKAKAKAQKQSRRKNRRN